MYITEKNVFLINEINFIFQPGSNQHSTPSPTTAVAMGGGPIASGGTVV